MIFYFLILLLTVSLLILFKKNYEYNNIKCIVVICGGARTFNDCIDSQYNHIINKLTQNNQNVDILFYLKKTDPGPKGQEGWDFEYDDVETETINNKINELKSKNINVSSKIIDKDEINDNELLKKVKDRSKYIDFLSNDDNLIRCLHQFYNFKKCGEILKKDYDYYIFLRPDLFFTEDCFPIEKYSPKKVTLQPDKMVDHYLDQLAIIPKDQFNNFFFGRMNFMETNTSVSFGKSEEIFAHTIDHETKKIGDFYIKR
jgi:hypothetical protein